MAVSSSMNPTTIEEALRRWKPMAYSFSEGDKDLLQVLLIEIWSIFSRFKRITDGLVKNRLHKRRLMYWRGRGVSLDNGPNTRRNPVDRLETEDQDSFLSFQIDPLALGRSYSLPADPEQEALFNISCQLLLDECTPQERAYWEARCAGWTWRDIEKAKVADRNQQPEIKARLRERFRRHFGC